MNARKIERVNPTRNKHGIEFISFVLRCTPEWISDIVDAIGVRECLSLGMQNIFAQMRSCFS